MAVNLTSNLSLLLTETPNSYVVDVDSLIQGYITNLGNSFANGIIFLVLFVFYHSIIHPAIIDYVTDERILNLNDSVRNVLEMLSKAFGVYILWISFTQGVISGWTYYSVLVFIGVCALLSLLSWVQAIRYRLKIVKGLKLDEK